jgi:hypothetical protein
MKIATSPNETCSAQCAVCDGGHCTCRVLYTAVYWSVTTLELLQQYYVAHFVPFLFPVTKQVCAPFVSRLRHQLISLRILAFSLSPFQIMQPPDARESQPLTACTQNLFWCHVTLCNGINWPGTFSPLHVEKCPILLLGPTWHMLNIQTIDIVQHNTFILYQLS